jgi:hypothetical protein
MRRALSVLVLLVCTLLVSACGVLRFPGGIFDSSDQKADARMAQIVEAINKHDAATLKAMFSPYALQGATDIDGGLDYLLSFFPHGLDTWTNSGVNTSGRNDSGARSTVLFANYDVTADGKEYWLYFSDFTVNDLVNPENVGIYGLGVVPASDPPYTSAGQQFADWASAMRLETNLAAGYPGVFVPVDDYVSSRDLVDARMGQIADAVNSHDGAALKALFSPRALSTAIDFDQNLESLLAMFPDGGLTWEREVVNYSGDDVGTVFALLTPWYKVSASGEPYWFFFADYSLDTSDPNNVGLAFLAATPRLDPSDPGQDQTLDDITNSWMVDDGGPTGIYVSAG